MRNKFTYLLFIEHWEAWISMLGQCFGSNVGGFGGATLCWTLVFPDTRSFWSAYSQLRKREVNSRLKLDVSFRYHRWYVKTNSHHNLLVCLKPNNVFLIIYIKNVIIFCTFRMDMALESDNHNWTGHQSLMC